MKEVLNYVILFVKMELPHNQFYSSSKDVDIIVLIGYI